MKKHNKTIFLAIIVLLIFGFINKNQKPYGSNVLKTTAGSEIKVVATTTILRDFAQQIIGDQSTVSVIIEAGMCPGHYDYTPSDINKVQGADIIFFHGFEWDQFLGELLNAAGNTGAAYSMSGDGSLGYTQWGSPANAPLFIDVLCNHLNNTYPLLNQTFNQNSAIYKQEIATTKLEIESLDTVYYNFTDTNAYIMNHQTAFLSWLGFNITGTWTKDDNSMTTGDLQAIIEGASETNTEIIIMNYQSGTDMGKVAADSLGIASVPLINFPGVYGVDSYLEQLDFNVALLNWALNNSPDPRPSSDKIGIDQILPLMIFFSFGLVIILLISKKRTLLK